MTAGRSSLPVTGLELDGDRLATWLAWRSALFGLMHLFHGWDLDRCTVWLAFEAPATAFSLPPKEIL